MGYTIDINDNEYHLGGDAMRYSKQRKLVYDVIASTKNHYSVDEIYDEASRIMPEIGIATVYRNVNQLVDSGMVRRIKSYDGIDHYDAMTNIHPHFICKCCGRVYDAKIPYDRLVDEIQSQVDDAIEDVEIILKGICNRCKEKGEN